MAFHEVGSPFFPIAQERDEFGDVIDLGMAAEQFGGAGRRSGASIEQRDIDFASGEGLIEDWKIADNQGEEPKSGNCFKDGDGAGGWRDGSNVSQAQSAKSASAHIHGSPADQCNIANPRIRMRAQTTSNNNKEMGPK